MPVIAVISTSLSVAVASDSVTASTSDARIVKETAALPSSASCSRTKLALMRDDRRPIFVSVVFSKTCNLQLPQICWRINKVLLLSCCGCISS